MLAFVSAAAIPGPAIWLSLYTVSMGKTVAVDYLADPQKHPVRPVCALFGDEDFLKRQTLSRLRAAVLGGGDGEFSYTPFDGRSKDLALRDVLEELDTIAMFGGRRLVAVEDADDFVTRWRPELESYVARPSSTGVLVLLLASFPATTKLYKAVAAEGLMIECRVPAGSELSRWLVAWAEQAHQAKLSTAAAEMLVEIVGPELGLIDQELAKLALLTGATNRITPELVSQSVGGWRAKTTWDMLDAALDGNVREAMVQLDRLLASGEQPVGLLAQIAGSLRRFAAATRVILQAEAAGRRIPLRSALEQAGIRSFVLQKAERQLRKLGRRRGAQLYEWLLQADLDLKGDSALPPRLVLERLILRISLPQQAMAT